MDNSSWKGALGAALSVGLLASPMIALPANAVETTPQPASVTGDGIIINEAFVTGGSEGTPYTNKYVELYNPTDAAVTLDGWSLQYRAAGSTATPGPSALSGSIPAKGYFLVQGGSNGSVGAPLPTADATTSFNPAAGGGVVVLANQATTVGALPAGDTTGTPGVVDLLGYGSATAFEGTVATPPGARSPQSTGRTAFADTDDNGADFTLQDPTPTNSAGATGAPTPEPTPTPTPTDPVTPGEVIPIRDIQGTGDATPLAGQTVTTRGKVTAAYPTGGFDGFYLQTPGTSATADQTASDALFVYSPATVGTVSVGDYVEVTGTAGEFYGLTQITVAAGNTRPVTDAAEEPKASTIELPATAAAREAVEGMLFQPEQDFVVSDNYTLNQYGELALAAGTERLLQPTEVARPGTPENAAVIADNAARGIRLDDGASTNFLTNRDEVLPYLTTENPVRVGYAADFVSPVVMDYRNSAWKFQPLSELDGAAPGAVQPVTFAGERPVAPAAVGGSLTIGSFNVLNYFSTVGDSLTGCTYYTDRAGKPITVNRGCDARGAATQESFERQEAKIVSAINALGADVVTLMEIENSAKFDKDRDAALSTLVDALNEKAPDTWAFVPSPATLPAIENEDVIRTAMIYKKALAEPVGESVILDDNLVFSNARKPLAQAFKPVGGTADQTFLAIVNHFKSKGSAPRSGDNVDLGDGQGAWNAARVDQAEALVAFADRVKAQVGTDKVFLTGDFNSYSQEDPMQVLYEAGYVNQGEKDDNYSYVFSGLSGSLDHVLASAAANSIVTGVDTWNINSVESVALEYSRYNNNVTDYYRADPYRASDHDPVIVGLDLVPATTTTVNLLNINDFHGRIDGNTVRFAGTVEQLRKKYEEDNTAFLSAGDNIGASLFASSLQDDEPTLDVLNALDLEASAVGNHEFDKGIDDLAGRVSDSAEFPYLGANVYAKGTTDPLFDEYTIIDVDGIDVAVIGVVTETTATLVSPGGIENVDFGDPVEAVNRVAAQIEEEDLADVIVAEYHEGAGDGAVEGATIEEEIAAGGPFAEIITETTPLVDAIFTGHTHKQYAWDAPVTGMPGTTRPVLQTGSYGEFIGRITLTVDKATGDVESYEAENVKRTAVEDAALVAEYPRVAEVKRIVDAAVAQAAVIGNEKVGSVTADITTAFTGGTRDDRGSESTLGNLVADSLVASLSAEVRGGAEIGVVNPGGLRNELYFGDDQGTVTFAEANAVLPFVNDLWTTTLTGAQFKQMLEQQWQPAGASKAFLALGLSDNVSVTYDPALAQGSRITSVLIDGEPLDAAKEYRIGTFSFLAQGGDNFTVFREGTDTRESGLVDRDAWIEYIRANSPLSPSFDRRTVQVQGAPTTVKAGETVNFTVSKLDLTSLGSPVNTSLEASFVAADGTSTELGVFSVAGGSATVEVEIPADAEGDGRLVLVAAPTATTVNLPVAIGSTVEFSDIAGNEHEDAITWLAEQGLAKGFDDGTYRPLSSINRDAMAAFLYRLAGEPEYEAPAVSPFSDITPATEFYKEMAWLEETGITTGYPDGTFRPVTPVNRDAMAAFMNRFAGDYCSIDDAAEYPGPTAAPFTDVSPRLQFAREIAWMKESGISTGWADGTYRPLTPVARDAMAAFIQRLDAYQTTNGGCAQ